MNTYTYGQVENLACPCYMKTPDGIFLEGFREYMAQGHCAQANLVHLKPHGDDSKLKISLQVNRSVCIITFTHQLLYNFIQYKFLIVLKLLV